MPELVIAVNGGSAVKVSIIFIYYRQQFFVSALRPVQKVNVQVLHSTCVCVLNVLFYLQSEFVAIH